MNTGNYYAGMNTGNYYAGMNTGNYYAGMNTGNYYAGMNTGNYYAGMNTGNHNAGMNTGNYYAGMNTGNHNSGMNTGNYYAGDNTGYVNMDIEDFSKQKEDNQIQKEALLNKQLIIRIQRLKNCHDVLGMIMSYAENYARMKGYKGKMEFNKYDYFYCSKNSGESLYRTKFIASLYNFENTFQFYIKNYGKFDFAKSLSEKEIIKRINNYKKSVPDEDKKIYDNIIKIISNKKTNVYEEELSKLTEKAKMDIEKMDIFLVASAKVDHENEIIEKKVMENNLFKPDMDLNQNEPDWTYDNFNPKKDLYPDSFK
jgi:hypothetical protein